MEDGFTIVGKSPPRVDAREKVTGEALYTADIYRPGMLHARVKRSEFPHARILHVDTVRARRLKGVMAVATAEDIPGEKAFGGVIHDNYPLAGDKVRCLGDAVAVVAAANEKIAEEAVSLIKVQYEELPPIFDPRRALEPGAVKIHPGGNLICHHKTRKGDVEKGFSESDIILERQYSTPRVEHAYIEPEAVLAEVGPDGSLTVWGSHQSIYNIRSAVCRVLGLPMSRVRIVQTAVGGSFGGKDDCMSVLSVRAGILSMMTGKPVRLVNRREDSLRESYKRHPYYLSYKVGVKKDGTLRAMEIDIIADGGAYASMSPFVTWRSVVHATGPYRVPHVKTDVRAVYTNNVYTGAFRGFGSPQVSFASESLLDEIARELRIDPLKLRRENLLRDGDITATGQKLNHRVSLDEVLGAGARPAGWEKKRKSFPEENRGKVRKKGIGLACSYRGVALGAEGVDATGAIVRIHADGSVDVCTGLVEMGQGLKTIFCQIAAEELGIDLDRISYRGNDTSLIVDGGPTVASRSTVMGGSAVRAAAVKLRRRLFKAASAELGVGPAELEARGEKIRLRKNPKKSVPFLRAVSLALDRGMDLHSFSWHEAPPIWWDEEKGKGDPYFTYVYGCDVVEVEVDTETGRVDVLKIWAAHDVGKAINPAAVRGQICGGAVMGVGMGLLEEVEIKNGSVRTVNLDNYLIPTALDVHEIETFIIENPDKYGPYGGKSIGEPTCEVAAPAVANAIAHATGKRIRDLPINLERVVLGRKLSK
jgi:CO/xanthine dehydrogenase Mo-binding subunit